MAPKPDGLPHRSPDVADNNEIFTPPFLGSRVAKGMSIDEIAEFLNLTALFRNQWGFRPEGDEDDNAYLMLHGLGVEIAEALAEMWHKRIREALGFVHQDGPALT